MPRVGTATLALALAAAIGGASVVNGSQSTSVPQQTSTAPESPTQVNAAEPGTIPVGQSEGIRDEVGTVGVGAGAGAIVGGIIGGLRGALIGAIVGSGGAIAATDGKDVELPAGTIIRLRVDAPIRVR